MSKKRSPLPGRSGRGAAIKSDPPKNHTSSTITPDEQDQSAEKPPQIAAPLTPDGLFVLLRDKILISEQTKRPGSSDPAIVELSFALRSFRRRFEGWSGPWSTAFEEFRKIEEAIALLSDTLPSHRRTYSEAVAAIARFGTTQDWAIIVARAQLSAFDELVKAARAARAVGLPLAPETGIIETPRTERWSDFAHELQAHFNHALPRRPKDAAYRFIAEVVPAITGEHPSFEAVKTVFKRKLLPDPKFEFGPEVPARRRQRRKSRGAK
jgi:hypothetical protein